MDITFISF